MQELNPVNGLSGTGDDLARTRLVHAIVTDEWDNGSQLADAVDVSRMTVSRFTDSEYVDGLALTDEGTRVLRQTRRSIVEDVREAYRQGGYEIDVDDVENVVEGWTELALHPKGVSLGTTPSQARQWFCAVIHEHGTQVGDVATITRIDDAPEEASIADAARTWLTEREQPFFLDDCPYELPDHAVNHIGGGLNEADL